MTSIRQLHSINIEIIDLAAYGEGDGHQAPGLEVHPHLIHRELALRVLRGAAGDGADQLQLQAHAIGQQSQGV